MTICLILCLFQWQQRVSYKIRANLDTEEHSIKAVQYFTYHNNSPYSLETLYFHLYANAYRDNNTVFAQEMRRMGYYDQINVDDSERGYIDINHVSTEDDSLQIQIDGTLMAVHLNQALKSGDSITLNINFYLKMPKQLFRLGYQINHYEVVQWYPKTCVFDEDGWHLETYHAIGEFYGEYGSFDVEIEVPGDYVVAATGERINPKDVEFIECLMKTGKKNDCGERKLVRFHAENVHDFAWVCDPNFLVRLHAVGGTAIFVFYLKKNEKGWRNAGAYAVDAVKRFNQWFGTYPYGTLTIVDGYFCDGMEYPQLVIIGPSENRFTRVFELVLVHEIGHQWFYGILGSNEIDEAWLDEGFTTYSEIRYLEDKYGENSSLIKLPFLPPISRRYYHQVIYYVTQTNRIEKPILTPAYKFVDVPLAYLNSAYSKSALFLINLEGILGRDLFDIILKKYVNDYKFKHPKTEDFINVCENVSGKNLKSLFHSFLNSTDFSDWAVKKVTRNTIEIENRGHILTPVDVFVRTNSGTQLFRVDTREKIHTIVLPKSSGKVKKVIIDPYGYALEPNHWNNYFPRRIKIRPIFDFPSLDAYTVLYLPYLWYSSYNGITTGMYFFGDQFADFDFVKGQHQWLFSCIYAFKSNNIYLRTSYQTPIIFKKGLRTRIIFDGSNADDENKISFGFINNFGVPLSQKPQGQMKNMISYCELNSYELTDYADWELGRNIVAKNYLSYKYANLDIILGLSGAHELMGSEWSYLKASFEVKRDFKIIFPVHVRLFGGKIFGDAPKQDMFFLSGKLRTNFVGHFFFGQKGYASPQEHFHVSGDGNMRGYQTLHIKSDEMFSINLEFPTRSPIRVFADFGYYGDYAFDVGACIVIGPLYINIPFYIVSDEPWKIRWSVGF